MSKPCRKAMNESQWTKNVCDTLEKVAKEAETSIVVTPLSASRHSVHGIPDRYFTSKLWRGFVEFKGVDTRVTPLQERFAKQQNLVVPYSCFVWRQVDATLLIKLEYFDVGDWITSLGYGDCLSVLSAMGDLYEGGEGHDTRFILHASKDAKEFLSNPHTP